MSKQTIYAAFSTQKGGAGKTTMTVLVASHLHYARDYNVAVIDYPQHSICEMRERDYKMVEQDVFYKKMARDQILRLGGKGFYPVIESSPQGALNEAKALCREGEYDFIFFDMPGTANSIEVINTLTKMDYIIAPITADRVVAESTLNYLISIRDGIMNKRKTNIKSILLFWNMVDGREKSELYGVLLTFFLTAMLFGASGVIRVSGATKVRCAGCARLARTKSLQRLQGDFV